MTTVMVFDRYGDPDVLHPAEVPDPRPAPGQVTVRVRAAGVQPADTRLRSGAWRNWNPVAFPARVGNEAAGVVEAVGAGVTAFKPGDEVFGPASGAYAELVAADADQLTRKPPEMPWTEAGVFSASGQTASTALEDLAVISGDTLLIHAAAGGVGVIATQLAVGRGARVIGTASPANHDFLRELGATPVEYGPGLVDRVRAIAPDGVDAVLDGAGGEALTASLDVAGKRDRIGTIADIAAAGRLGVRAIGTRRSAERLAELVDLYSRRRLRVFIWKEFPLARAADAHRESERGHLRGKIVLTV